MLGQKLIIATNNPGKAREIKQIFSDTFASIATLKDEGLQIEVVEDGSTFLANAIKKAVTVNRQTGLPALADDSGICVKALNGAPGVYSARFAGEYATDEENNAKLIRLMSDVPEGERQARYVCTVALAYDEFTIITSHGEMEGEIVLHPKGENGFGYDPYFFIPSLGKTAAEISAEEKNAISHRGKALHSLREKL